MAENKGVSLTTHGFARKAGRIILIVISSLSMLILIVVGVLLLWSPGKMKPFVDENGNPLEGSISEKIRVNINGLEQGMFIQSRDATNPVLLYVHGGLPEYFLTKKYHTGLEEDFTVVWWEQRGSGLSFRADLSPESVTVDQFISDTLAVTNYLRQRFGKEKIYLTGHSGGSFVGMLAAAQHQSCIMPSLEWLRCQISLDRKNWRMTICFSSSKSREMQEWSKNSKQRQSL